MGGHRWRVIIEGKKEIELEGTREREQIEIEKIGIRKTQKS